MLTSIFGMPYTFWYSWTLDILLFLKTYRTTSLPVRNTLLTNIPKGLSSKMPLEVAEKAIEVSADYMQKTHVFAQLYAFSTKINAI